MRTCVLDGEVETRASALAAVEAFCTTALPEEPAESEADACMKTLSAVALKAHALWLNVEKALPRALERSHDLPTWKA